MPFLLIPSAAIRISFNYFVRMVQENLELIGPKNPIVIIVVDDRCIDQREVFSILGLVINSSD